MAKKIFKILGIALGVGFVLLVIFVIAIINYLPSAKDINQYFKREKITNPQPQLQPKLPQNFNLLGTEVAEHKISEEKPNLGNNHSHRFNQGLENLLKEERPVSDFCTRLSTARSGSLKLFEALANQDGEKKTLTETDFDRLNDEDFNDLRLEAVRPVITQILRKPAMQKFVSMILQVESMSDEQKKALAESDGFLNKAQLYAQAYQVYSEMKHFRSEYESVMDRSYLMYKLNDLIALKPELQSDQRVLRFCEESEHLLNTQSPVVLENEKQAFERLISELGVDTKAIKYNPDYKTKLDFKFSGNSLEMSGGWLEELVPATQNH